MDKQSSSYGGDNLTAKELIAYLMECDPESEVFISCEGGCVVDNEISIKQEGSKVILEIE